jgi:hypothetical protein
MALVIHESCRLISCVLLLLLLLLLLLPVELLKPHAFQVGQCVCRPPWRGGPGGFWSHQLD